MAASTGTFIPRPYTPVSFRPSGERVVLFGLGGISAFLWLLVIPFELLLA